MSNTRFWCEYSLYENCFLYIETGAHYKAKNQPLYRTIQDKNKVHQLYTYIINISIYS
jgi:hypothetical protein